MAAYHQWRAVDCLRRHSDGAAGRGRPGGCLDDCLVCDLLRLPLYRTGVPTAAVQERLIRPSPDPDEFPWHKVSSSAGGKTPPAVFGSCVTLTRAAIACL